MNISFKIISMIAVVTFLTACGSSTEEQSKWLDDYVYWDTDKQKSAFSETIINCYIPVYKTISKSSNDISDDNTPSYNAIKSCFNKSLLPEVIAAAKLNNVSLYENTVTDLLSDMIDKKKQQKFEEKQIRITEEIRIEEERQIANAKRTKWVPEPSILPGALCSQSIEEYNSRTPLLCISVEKGMPVFTVVDFAMSSGVGRRLSFKDMEGNNDTLVIDNGVNGKFGRASQSAQFVMFFEEKFYKHLPKDKMMVTLRINYKNYSHTFNMESFDDSLKEYSMGDKLAKVNWQRL